VSHCLADETILELALGAASDAERAHARGCVGCRGRLRAWARDLDLFREAFAAPPPRARTPRRLAAFPSLAAAAVLLVAVGVAWTQRGAEPEPTLEARRQPVARYALDVSSAIFDSCTGRRFVETGCNDYTAALYF